MLISDKKDPLQRILDKKRYFKKEINVALFEYCSNRCSFCFQQNDDRTNLNPSIIKKKADLICNLIDEEPNNDLALKIFGGELFEDSVTIDNLKSYALFIKQISDKCKQLKKNLSITLVTNLLADNRFLIEKFIKAVRNKGIEINLAASFDFIGRFHSQNSLDLFMKNLLYLKPYIKSINMVITKPNIDILLKNKTSNIKTREAFDLIYENFDAIACDYYNPDIGTCHISIPSDKDLLDFFYYAIDNYPKIMPVNCWVSGKESDLSCEATIGISSRGETRSDSSLQGHCVYRP